MSNGWIKIHRKFIEWQWFGNSEAVHLFLYILLKANHADKMWQGHDVKRGQLITSIGHLSIATGISQRSVRTLLKKFENTGEIEVKTTNKFTLVSVCKYECYQIADEESDKQNVTQTTIKRQSTDKQLTTNKNDKNYKNEKNVENIIPTLEEFCEYGMKGLKPGYRYPIEAKYNQWVEAGWVDGHGKKIKNWKTKLANTIPFLKPMEVEQAKAIKYLE
jgi:hypothetical protein